MKHRERIFRPTTAELAKLAHLLRPWFLPASMGTPPGALGGNGGRTVVAVNQPPTDGTMLALVGGTVTWRFTTKFNKPPRVHIDAVGAPPTNGGVPAVLYIQAVAANAVIITSTINTDTRVLHLTATGNPN